MTEVESPPSQPNVLDQARKIVNRIPDLPPDDSSEYETSVGSIEASMIKICRELRPNFEKGRYGLIIVDDTSGRLPGLAIKGVADFISDTYNLIPPGIVFIQAGQMTLDREVADQINKRVLSQMDKIKDKKILVVTDFISSGYSTYKIGQPLLSNRIGFDIVALSVSSHSQYSIRFQELKEKGIRIIRGLESTSGPKIHSRDDLTGVTKGEEARTKVLGSKRDAALAARRDIRRLVNRTIREIYANLRR